VDLFEYQARDVLASHGVPVLPGGVAETPEQAEAIAREIGTTVVVKAQVKTGGRGKAGGVKLADDADEARARAQDILGLDIKGHITRRVMVAQASDIAEEYYFSYLLDRSNRTFLAMASVEGGVEISRPPASGVKVMVGPASRRATAGPGGFPAGNSSGGADGDLPRPAPSAPPPPRLPRGGTGPAAPGVCPGG